MIQETVKTTLFFISSLYFVVPLPAKPSPVPVEYISTIDGDTFRAKINGEVIKIRLTCVDAPGLKQRLGQWAKLQLHLALSSGAVSIATVGKSYDRDVANVYVDGRSVSARLSADGAVLPYSTYKKGCVSDWSDILKGARESKARWVGVYAVPIEVPDWEFRRLNKQG